MNLYDQPDVISSCAKQEGKNALGGVSSRLFPGLSL